MSKLVYAYLFEMNIEIRFFSTLTIPKNNNTHSSKKETKSVLWLMIDDTRDWKITIVAFCLLLLDKRNDITCKRFGLMTFWSSDCISKTIFPRNSDGIVNGFKGEKSHFISITTVFLFSVVAYVVVESLAYYPHDNQWNSNKNQHFVNFHSINFYPFFLWMYYDWWWHCYSTITLLHIYIFLLLKSFPPLLQ